MIKRLIISFLALSARRAVLRDKPAIAAVTGSFGKSSVKEAMATAMGAREAGSGVRCSVKNYNNEFGVPFTILNVHAPGRDPLKWLKVLWRALWVGWGMGRVGADTLILEMGADHPGDLSWLIGIARPDVAVVTAVAEAHSEFFGTVEDIAEEKSALVRSLPKDGLVVLNNDDPRVTAMRRKTECEAVYFGFSEGSDVQVAHAEPAVTEDERGHAVPAGIRAELAIKGKTYRFTLKGTIGRPQAHAAAAALAVAGAFDVPVRLAIERLEKDYHGMSGRTRIIPGIKHTTIIDDSYNAASPVTVISALKDVAGIPVRQTQRRIAALGDMRELGEYAASAHESVGRAAADAGIDILVTCGTLARVIADAARKAGLDAKNVREFDTSPEAGLHLQKIIRPGDLILVKGSQGSRMEKIVKELMAEPQEAPFLLVRMSDEWQRIK